MKQKKIIHEVMSTKKKQRASPIYDKNKLVGRKPKKKIDNSEDQTENKTRAEKRHSMQIKNIFLHQISFSQRQTYNSGLSTDQSVLQCIIQINR